MWQRSALAIAILVLMSGICSAKEAEVWFGVPQPRPDVEQRLRQNPAGQENFLAQLENQSSDWTQFFEPALFNPLVPRFQTYLITTGSFLGMPDNDLVPGIARLSSRGRKLAFVVQPVIVNGLNCGHSEGYEDERVLNAAVDKLRRLNIQVDYLVMDGGLWYGHYATGRDACGLNLDQTIRQTAITVRAFAKAFPNIVVGDIEPTVPLTQHADWQVSLRNYKRGLESVTGEVLDFLELDIAWNNPEWEESVVAETRFARSLGMHIGYIYNGDGEDRSDAEWLAHARNNIAEIEGGLGLIPDHVSIVSWNLHPAHIVGSPVDTTLASLLPWYAQPEARITLADDRKNLGGRVLDGAGAPLAGYSVKVEVTAAKDGGEHPGQESITGIVPARAAAAIIGVRINTECLCRGRDDILIGQWQYAESGGVRRESVDFTPEFRRLMNEAKPNIATVRLESYSGETFAHVTASPDQSLLLNSKMFAVTPDSQYEFTTRVRDILGTDMFGQITIIWLDSNQQGLARDNLIVRPDFELAASLTTDSAGRFSAAWPRTSQGAPAPLRIIVPDQKGHRAALMYR